MVVYTLQMGSLEEETYDAFFENRDDEDDFIINLKERTTLITCSESLRIIKKRFYTEWEFELSQENPESEEIESGFFPVILAFEDGLVVDYKFRIEECINFLRLL